MKLILLPGLDGTGKLFKPLEENNFTNLKVKAIGYPEDQLLDYSNLANFVLPLLPKKEPFILLAESFSGPVAIKFAASSINNLKAVILVATFASNPMLIPGNILSLFVTSKLIKHSPFSFLAKRYMVGEKVEKPLLKDFLGLSSKMYPEVVAFRVKCLLQIDVTEELSNCRVPVLYIKASKDKLIKQRNLNRILKYKPDIIVENVEGPHLISQSNPVGVWKAIDDFLSKIVLTL